MSKSAKIWLGIKFAIVTAAATAPVQDAVKHAVNEHPFLSVLGAVLTVIGALFTNPESKPNF